MHFVVALSLNLVLKYSLFLPLIWKWWPETVDFLFPGWIYASVRLSNGLEAEVLSFPFYQDRLDTHL